MVKILNSNYAKAELKKVANNKNQMNDEERTMLINLLEDFGDLFNGTLGN